MAWSNDVSSITKFETLEFSTEQEYTNYPDTNIYYADYNMHRYIYWEKDGKYFVLSLPLGLTLEADHIVKEFTELEEYKN